MADWPGDATQEHTTFGHLTRGQLMARVHSKGNKTTEARLIGLLRSSKITGWRRHQRIFGRPDFVWPKKKLAVFVDGCFWHGHGCGKNLSPQTNSKAWEIKLRRNQKRDRLVTKTLRVMGWRVVRIWECELRTGPKSNRRIKNALGG